MLKTNGASTAKAVLDARCGTAPCQTRCSLTACR
nr:MAG TPA: hypothetical protein [Caudoviricetes sp.]